MIVRRFALLLLAASATAAAAPDEECEDGHSSCGSWADGGECSKNPGFMRTTCPEACRFCTPPPLLEKQDDPLLGDERVVLQLQWGSPPNYGEIGTAGRLELLTGWPTARCG